MEQEFRCGVRLSLGQTRWTFYLGDRWTGVVLGVGPGSVVADGKRRSIVGVGVRDEIGDGSQRGKR